VRYYLCKVFNCEYEGSIIALTQGGEFPRLNVTSAQFIRLRNFF